VSDLYLLKVVNIYKHPLIFDILRIMKNLFELFLDVGELKRTERKGWKRAGIDDPESVSDHSFRAAFMAFILGEKFDLDSSHLIKLLLIHDIAEAKTGDLTPHDYDTVEEKFEIEKKAVESIFDPFTDENRMIELWKEFETGESREAKIARDIDKLEMIIQALEYKEEFPDKDFSKFIQEGNKKIESQEIKDVLEELSKR